MARKNLTFKVNLRLNKMTTSKSYGMYFFEAQRNEPLSLKGFAKHLSEHGKLATYEMLVLVLQNVVSCMKELITQGQPVKLDGLGTFYPSIKNAKGSNNVEDAVENMNARIGGVRLNFLPEGVKDEKLTSKALKEMCIFEANDVIVTKEKYVGGKKVTYQERTPIKFWGVSQAEPEPAPKPEPDDEP